MPLPLMNELVDAVDLRGLLGQGGISWDSENRSFEDLYSELSATPHHDAIRELIERQIRSYFSQLRPPEAPGMYDRLILSLRPKDVIATFNWDPFLIHAAYRNREFHDRFPKLLFLHGSVASAYCEEHQLHGVTGSTCPHCSEPLVPTPLLFPVAKKDYTAHPAIAHAWGHLQHALANAQMITVFGYSAPVSDVDARLLLQDAWGTANTRKFEQIEIIDIRPEDELLTAWDSFIHSHHYDVFRTLQESWVSKHPRRTGEAYLSQYIEAKFIDDDPLPEASDFEALWNAVRELISHEDPSA